MIDTLTIATFNILRPETELERSIISHPDVIKGLWWGKPRGGHPEGQVVNHVKIIFDNILLLVDDGHCGDAVIPAAVPRGSEMHLQLRLIAILHDSFKYAVDSRQPKHGENHHAMRARRFVEQNFNYSGFTTQMLDVIELHDEAYNAWSCGNRDGRWDKAEGRLMKLLQRLDEHKSGELFTRFYQCDTHTDTNDRPDFDWYNKKSGFLKTWCSHAFPSKFDTLGY